MAEGVLGLGAGQAASLNNELIDKLKTAERKSSVEPLETKLKDWETEKEKVTEITDKAKELLEAIKPFDLFVTSGTNIFDEKSAKTTGESVIFDAVDVGALNLGTTNVNITSLAQRDVYQSTEFTDKNATVSSNAGDKITITHGVGPDAKTSEFKTNGKTYEALVKEINKNPDFNATIEQINPSEYRIVIKSAESGTSNALSISQTGVDLGLETAGNHTLTAGNLTAVIDGVDYSVSSNAFIVDGGLKITAVKLGTSTITVEKDNTNIETKLQEFVDKYNELNDLVDNELYSPDSKIDNKSTLRSMMTGIKDKLFGSYGKDGKENLFVVGFELSKNGQLTLNSKDFKEALERDPGALKDLFIGVAENKGLGTQLKEFVDSLDGFEGLLSNYDNSLTSKKEALEKQKERAIESLDSKYVALSAQFAAYGNIINQFESSFSGLKLMIDQSTA